MSEHQTMTTVIGNQENWTLVYTIRYDQDERGRYADIEIVRLENPAGEHVEHISGLMISALRQDVAEMHDQEIQDYADGRWGPA